MRWRLALVLVGFTTLVLLVQNIPLASYLRTVEKERIIANLQGNAYILAATSIPAVLPLPPTTGLTAKAAQDQALANLRAQVVAISAETNGVVVVVDKDGFAIASSEGRVGEDYRNRPEILLALGKAPDPTQPGKFLPPAPSADERPSATLGEPLVFSAVPTRAGSLVLGAVRISYPLSKINDKVNDGLRGLGLAALITLLCAVVIAALVSATVTRRIRRLRDAAEQLAEGDLDARAELTGGGGEIEELAQSFNTMADRVQGVVESQRGFAGDASHQLRTPLTALRLRLDRAADLMPDDDPAIDQVDAARDEIDRLQRLIDGLLVLARADNRDQQLVAIDVSQIAVDRVEAWQALADERSVTIQLDAPGMAVALLVPSAAEQIIDNYIDNALEVVPEGSLLLVTVRSEPGGVTLMVDDQGPGLPPEDRERAFDRFWRGTQDGEGSGLGLAVVASLVTAGGGTVWLDRSPLGGLRAAARFRSQPPSTGRESQRGRHS
jgi:signal transduction histidine kinase